MRKGLFVILFIWQFPAAASAQNWQSVFLLDARGGFTSNTFLNPFLAEWDRSGEVGYLMMAPMGQLAMDTGRFSSDLTAGVIYQPFFDERESWTGFFGLTGARYRINNQISLGIEGGASNFSTINDRELYWIQPTLRWSPGLFTQLQLKAGSTFLNVPVENGEPDQSSKRFDSYTLEFETWPNFKWQLRSSLFGSLAEPAENIGLRGAADYWITRTFQFTISAGIQQYRFEVMTENGGTPVIGPGGEGETTDESDRILRAGLGTTYQVNRNVALSLQADYLNYHSSAVGESTGDLHVSAGVRLSFFPESGRRGKADVEWSQNDTQSVILKLNYSGEGDLFILGDFNDWEQPGVPLSRQSRNRYAAQLTLPPGLYEYKILLIDGSEETWVEFSDDTYTVSDGFGGENGLIFID